MFSTKVALIGAAAGGLVYYFLPPTVETSEIEEKNVSKTSLNPNPYNVKFEEPKNPLLFRSMYCGAPHPSKRHLNPDPSKQYQSFGAGEDSGFISPHAIGIGDGVGGWNRHPNANVALFSRLLMHYCREFLQTKDDLIEAMREARSKIPDTVVGSSTCLLVRYDSTSETFETANLGDSNYVVIRDRDLYHTGKITQNAFNFPCQIGTRGNDPAECALESVDARKGDIVVLSSDGLWDNLFTNEILDIVNEYTNEKGVIKAESAAQGIVKETVRVWQSSRDGPFAQEAQKQGQYFSGAKVDDCVVIVSQLLAAESKL